MDVEERIPFWPEEWGRPDPDEYEGLLRDSVLEAEEHDLGGDDGDARFRAGYAMGLRVAAGLYGMPEGQDPANRRG